ncbi:MAG: response regulator [Methanosarcinales archaeon]|nr:MAG: response regulator [Methanosarcinales archaeon]
MRTSSVATATSAGGGAAPLGGAEEDRVDVTSTAGAPHHLSTLSSLSDKAATENDVACGLPDSAADGEIAPPLSFLPPALSSIPPDRTSARRSSAPSSRHTLSDDIPMVHAAAGAAAATMSRSSLPSAGAVHETPRRRASENGSALSLAALGDVVASSSSAHSTSSRLFTRPNIHVDTHAPLSAALRPMSTNDAATLAASTVSAAVLASARTESSTKGLPSAPLSTVSLTGTSSSSSSPQAVDDLVTRFDGYMLVVDDTTANRKLLVRLLSRLCPRATILNACDGAEALARYAEHPDIRTVFMDREMPGMRGDEVATRLRRLGYAHLLVGVTGDMSTADKEEFTSHGADHVISKPVQANTVRHLLHAHLRATVS